MMKTITAYDTQYESLRETLILLSIPGFKESIAQADEEIARGETFSLAEIIDTE